jgi:hypothetical protein
MPVQTEFHSMRLGTIAVQSVDTLPTILYQKPPKGFVDGFFRGTANGAVLGGHVGKELAKAFITQAPDVTLGCIRINHDPQCGIFMVTVPVVGLLALVAIPPLVTATAGIQGGFSAYTPSEVEEWENTLTTVHKQVQIQTTFRDHVVQSLALCCPGHLINNVPSIVESSEVLNLQNVDTILRIEVLELGLAEASLNEPLDPDENGGAINPMMAKAIAPLNAIFQKSRSSLYLLVRTSLVRGSDNGLIDQRQFGYLSIPRPYMEWSENNGSRFRAELLAAYRSLGDQIVGTLIILTNRRNGTDYIR